MTSWIGSERLSFFFSSFWHRKQGRKMLLGTNGPKVTNSVRLHQDR